MRALVLEDSGPSLIRDYPDPPSTEEALIRLLVAGICATDIELVRGYMHHRGVLGHEWVGVVEEAPDRSWIGRRVVGSINCSCGTCPTCRGGRPSHCPSRSVMGIMGREGAFSEHFRMPVANLRAVPEEVDDRAAVFAEPLAAACEIVEANHIRPTDRVVVLGIGRLGQLCARVLALTGSRVQALSRNSSRFDLLPPGVESVHAGDADTLAGADIVVDCTGSTDGIALATRLVRPRGTIVLKTTTHDAAAVTSVPWVVDEITLVGSRCGPFEPALRLLAAGLVDPRPLATHIFPLDEGVRALDVAAGPDALKVLITP
ncbi:MAG: alcohol dehydrogenase [Gemmatimonadetes bacterium]|nr:alcohol dehydrogenase [Gemmatimonadota bacterium]